MILPSSTSSTLRFVFLQVYMEEGDAMERGEIPANRFHSFSMESRTVTFHRAGTHADLFKS
jgi:hypothetical protein